MTDSEYLLSMLDYTFAAVPEIKAHHERMRSIAARLATYPLAAAVPQQEAGEPATPSVAGLSAVPELPVVAWVTAADVKDFGTGPGESMMLFAPRGKWNIGMTLQAPAQATIAAQAAEIERLKRDLYSERAASAKEALGLSEEIVALKAKQVADVEAVMRLADEYAEARVQVSPASSVLFTAPVLAAREALCAHLTKDRK